VNTPSQENLLGYVLGALDAQEQRNVQQLIDENPAIEEQLLQIKNSIIPLDCLESTGPPPGLARRTCESVAGWQNESELVDPADSSSLGPCIQAAFEAEASHCENALAAADQVGADDDHGPLTPMLRSSVSQRFLHPRTWSIPDVLVGMALIAIMAGILFPAISYTRYNSRIVDCQHNMGQIGMALMSFSSAHEGQFVVIPRDGKLSNVGSFGPILKDSGFVEDDSVFSCAGVAGSLPPVHIPSCDQIKNSQCAKEMDHYRRTMSGHYGYTMGYEVDGQYQSPRNMGRSNVVLVADRPSCLPGRVSQNHGGKGQNCLFEDGRVEFVRGHVYGGDAIFENDYGIVGPGSHESDNVIAPSHLSLAKSGYVMELIEADAR